MGGMDQPSVEERIRDYAARRVAEAPPLSDSQRDRIALLLRRRDPDDD